MKILLQTFRKPWFFPLVILTVMAAAFGYQIHRLGFYWDDWQLVYLSRLGNPDLFWQYYAYDRPLAAWTYNLTVPLLGANPLHWQLFTLVMRWLGVVGLWWTLRLLWPGSPRLAGWVSLLLAVYPGFTQQPVALTYSLFFVLYACFTFSLAFSLRALRSRRFFWLLTALALVLSLIQVMTMEYAFGLELLRPLLIFWVIREAEAKFLPALGRALKLWLPYALVLAVFLVWRFIIFQQTTPDPEANAPLLLINLFKNPLPEMIHLFQNIAQDFSFAAVFVWLKAIQPDAIDFSLRTNLASWALSLGFGALAVLYFVRVAPEENTTSQGSKAAKAGQVILLGLLGVILGGLPVWSTNRQIIVGMWSDRFSLTVMLGIVLLLVGLVEWVSNKPLPRAVVLAVFLSLALAFQMQNQAKYRLNWEAQRDYYWQLAWRAPQLKPGAAVLGTKVPFGLSAEYSVGFALNTIYAPGLKTAELPFWFFSAVSDRGGSIVDYKEGLPLRFDLRTVHYSGTTSNGVVVQYKYGESCLRVLSEAESRYPFLTGDEVELLRISHPEQIIVSGEGGALLPVEIFGPEPVHDWCYYFQKADLARQTREWEMVIDLNSRAEKLGLVPKNGYEWSPLILAHAWRGEWDAAAEVTSSALGLNRNFREYFCGLWEDLILTTPPTPARQETAARVKVNLGCN